MASTRNKNTPEDYCLQHRSYVNAGQYTTYGNSQYGKAVESAFPCFGVNMGHMPSTVLARNPIDIESNLFGINSTNLVNPAKPTIAEINNLPNVAFFPRKPVYLPKPLFIQNDQRPFPIPE